MAFKEGGRKMRSELMTCGICDRCQYCQFYKERRGSHITATVSHSLSWNHKNQSHIYQFFLISCSSGKSYLSTTVFLQRYMWWQYLHTYVPKRPYLIYTSSAPEALYTKVIIVATIRLTNTPEGLYNHINAFIAINSYILPRQLPLMKSLITMQPHVFFITTAVL